MAGLAQQFQSSWLRNGQTRWKDSPILPNIRPGGQLNIASRIWKAWWVGEALFILSQGRADRTTWLGSVWGAQSRVLPLLTRVAESPRLSAGSLVWNNWFWDTAFTPVQRLAPSVSAGVYAYTGEPAFLQWPHSYFLTTLGTSYDYDGGASSADRSVSVDSSTYAYLGQNVSFITSLQHLVMAASPGQYVYLSVGNNLLIISRATTGTLLTTSIRTVLGPKRISETVSPPFDFGAKTQAGDVLTSPVVTISVWSGVDPTPGNMYHGAFLVVGGIVYPTLSAGVPGVIYQISVTVQASVSGILTQDAFLAVLPDSL